MIMIIFCILLLVLLLALVSANVRGINKGGHHGGLPRGMKVHPNITSPLSRSVTKMNTIDTPKKFSVVSMALDHHSEGTWHIPSLHDKYSAGWNRSFYTAEKNMRPYACTIK
jgi:hypothetical protein